jgi:hypothetical protein
LSKYFECRQFARDNLGLVYIRAQAHYSSKHMDFQSSSLDRNNVQYDREQSILRCLHKDSFRDKYQYNDDFRKRDRMDSHYLNSILYSRTFDKDFHSVPEHICILKKLVLFILQKKKKQIENFFY